jgi:hypothetical protein
MTDWVELICCVPLGFRTGEKSIRQLFEPALAHLDDRATFLAAINRWLREHPDLIHAWEAYCTDKRTGRGPCFDLNSVAVTFYDSSAGATAAPHRDKRLHTDPAKACADFIYREAAWVLRGARAN